MAGKESNDELLWEAYTAYIQAKGCKTTAAKKLGIPRSTFRCRLDKFAEVTGTDINAEVFTGSVHSFESIEYKLPKKNKIARYIVTAAQNNTHVHDTFLDNLIAYSKHCNAQLMVSQISYNKASYGKKAVKVGKAPTAADKEDLWFDARLEDYFFNDRIVVAPTLTLCGEQNIVPTAVRPLSGFHTYPGAHTSAIFPHTTLALESIPVMRGAETKINYTTGAITLRNYVAKKAGLKADFHHTYGALLVEVNSKGEWWVRQLNAKEDGSFYDLDVHVHKGKVTQGNNIEAINWGDVHWEVVDPVVAELNWGKGGILDTLQPEYQFMHDSIDFYARNHHSRGNPHANYQKWLEGRSDVRSEFIRVRDFLNNVSYRSWCQTVIIDSNHDNALERWLREGEYRTDPMNALFFLECQTMKYQAMSDRDKEHHLIEDVLTMLGVKKDVKFLREDESFTICGTKRGIECGMHGHLGANGSRGSATGLSKVGNKANTGHTHTAGIIQGLYVAGTCSKLKLDYTKGPSSWSHSHILTYKNGKRAILTIRNGKWRG